MLFNNKRKEIKRHLDNYNEVKNRIKELNIKIKDKEESIKSLQYLSSIKLDSIRNNQKKSKIEDNYILIEKYQNDIRNLLSKKDELSIRNEKIDSIFDKKLSQRQKEIVIEKYFSITYKTSKCISKKFNISIDTVNKYHNDIINIFERNW